MMLSHWKKLLMTSETRTQQLHDRQPQHKHCQLSILAHQHRGEKTMNSSEVRDLNETNRSVIE